MLTFLPVAKFAVQLVANIGVSKIVRDIVTNNVVITTAAQKVTVGVGTFVLGSMIVEQATGHIERTTTELAAWLEKQKLQLVVPEEFSKKVEP